MHPQSTILPRRIQCSCEKCAKSFTIKASAAKRPGAGRFCSRSCLAKSRVGPLHPRWKNTRHPNHDGYVRLTGDVLEHRAVIERVLGRHLRSDEHVHHVNGDKADNRLENLQVVTPGEHRRIHQTGRKISGWSRKYTACLKCGTNERPYGAKGLCQRCYSLQWYHRQRGK